jgi:hypothetical protein
MNEQPPLLLLLLLLLDRYISIYIDIDIDISKTNLVGKDDNERVPLSHGAEILAWFNDIDVDVRRTCYKSHLFLKDVADEWDDCDERIFDFALTLSDDMEHSSHLQDDRANISIEANLANLVHEALSSTTAAAPLSPSSSSPSPSSRVPSSSSPSSSVDVDATMTSMDASAMEPTLRRLLRAYVMWNPRVGYCQGMNFIMRLLLEHNHPPRQNYHDELHQYHHQYQHDPEQDSTRDHISTSHEKRKKKKKKTHRYPLLLSQEAAVFWTFVALVEGHQTLHENQRRDPRSKYGHGTDYMTERCPYDAFIMIYLMEDL